MIALVRDYLCAEFQMSSSLRLVHVRDHSTIPEAALTQTRTSPSMFAADSESDRDKTQLFISAAL